MNGAEIVVKSLVRHGVKTVFGYPGGAVLPLYDELYKYQAEIRHVITAHEQGAAHAADGFARAGGEIGVVIATSGPGATNIVTGIANAYLDSIPVVALTGNVTTSLLGRDSFQEVDIVGITMPVVKHSYIVRDVAALEKTLQTAFLIAKTGRPGPVLIDIPRDIQTAECVDLNLLPLAAPPPELPDPSVLAQAVQIIAASSRPYIYAGGGVVSSGTTEILLALAEKLSAPIGCSIMGLTAVPADSPFSLGMTGMHGAFAASLAKDAADCLIAIGARFSDRATGDKNEYRRGRKIIHLDIDLAEINKNIPVDVELLGDLRVSLPELLAVVPQKNNAEWWRQIAELRARQNEFLAAASSAKITPQNLIALINHAAPSDAVIATDVGQHQMWTAQYYRFTQPRSLVTSGGLGTMGFGLGAAIGAAIAGMKNDAPRPVVLFTGDGSFGMNLNELATAVSQKLPLLIVVMNNGVLGMVRQWQTTFYDKRYSQTTLNRQTDFVKVAEAFGAHGVRVQTITELQTALQNHSALWREPLLLDCVIDCDERVLPMIPPGRSVRDIIVN